MSIIVPKVKAFLVCKKAAKNGDFWSLTEIFGGLKCPNVPVAPFFDIYFRLSGLVTPGSIKLAFDVIDSTDIDQGEVSCGRGEFDIPNTPTRMDFLEHGFTCPQGAVIFRNYGIHDVRMLYHGVLVDSVPIHIHP